MLSFRVTSQRRCDAKRVSLQPARERHQPHGRLVCPGRDLRVAHKLFFRQPAVSAVETTSWGVPGSPVVKTLHFQHRGAQARFLVTELRSCVLRSVAKKLLKILERACLHSETPQVHDEMLPERFSALSTCASSHPCLVGRKSLRTEKLTLPLPATKHSPDLCLT